MQEMSKQAITSAYLSNGEELLAYRDTPKGKFRRQSSIELVIRKSNGEVVKSFVNGTLFSLVNRYTKKIIK